MRTLHCKFGVKAWKFAEAMMSGTCTLALVNERVADERGSLQAFNTPNGQIKPLKVFKENAASNAWLLCAVMDALHQVPYTYRLMLRWQCLNAYHHTVCNGYIWLAIAIRDIPGSAFS
eukprot:1154255-Pelagomonas_calceolata.AAC.2